MGIFETEPTYEATCDYPGCYACGPESHSEKTARREVLDPDMGWGEVDGKLYCPDHIAKARRAPDRERRKGVR